MPKIQNSFSIPRPAVDSGPGNPPLNRASTARPGAPVTSGITDQFIAPNDTTLPGPAAVEGTGPVNASPHLTYYGGMVLDHASLSNIYVGDFWNQAGASQRAFNDSFTQDIGHSSLASVWAQYGVGQATFDKSTVVPGPAPATVSDADLQNIVAQQIATGNVSPNDQGLYTVMLPPGTFVDTGFKDHKGNEITSNSFGGYHGYFLNNGKPTFYSVIPYTASNDSMTSVGSHEITEALTDPVTSFNIPSSHLAWYDSDQEPGFSPGDSQWGEIGDIGASVGGGDAQVDGFMMQGMWSNDDNQVEVAAVTPGAVKALPAPAGTAPFDIN